MRRCALCRHPSSSAAVPSMLRWVGGPAAMVDNSVNSAPHRGQCYGGPWRKEWACAEGSHEVLSEAHRRCHREAPKIIRQKFERNQKLMVIVLVKLWSLFSRSSQLGGEKNISHILTCEKDISHETNTEFRLWHKAPENEWPSDLNRQLWVKEEAVGTG